MANISAYLQKALLDWTCGGAAATQPAKRWAALSLGTPSSVSGSEIPTASGYSRITALFGAAASPAGSVSNTAAMTFGPFSASMAVQGALLYDDSTVGSNNILFYGTLSAAKTVNAGDQIIFSAGQMIATLA